MFINYVVRNYMSLNAPVWVGSSVNHGSNSKRLMTGIHTQARAHFIASGLLLAFLSFL
jgi:hypothetical protein